MDVRYLYSVNPKKPIRTIKGVPILRTPKSLQLTKEEVRECLKYGTVYRRFANEGRNERVTINTVDRFHNAKYMTEKEYEDFLEANIDSNTGTVINNVVPEEQIKEEKFVEQVSVQEPEATEETLKEISVVNENISEETSLEEQTKNNIEETVENEEDKKYQENNKNYSGKKHKR